MRFTINREQLLKGLTTAMKAVDPKSSLPHLSNVKLSLTEKGLEITGIDVQLTIKTIVPYMINGVPVITNYKYGETLVNCRLIVELVKKLEGSDVTLDLIDGTILKIDDGKLHSNTRAMTVEEFPDVNLNMAGLKVDVPAADLIALVEQTAFAAHQKQQNLMVVNLVANNRILTAVATDTARLARKRVPIDSDVSFVANISAKNLLEIVHSFEGAETITLTIVPEKKALFAFDNTIIATTLSSADYPKTEHIFKSNFNYSLEINAKELLSAIDQVSLFSAEHDGVVKLVMTEDEVEIFSKTSSIGSANKKISTFQYSGERLEVNFIGRYVVDAIRAIKSEDVLMLFIADKKAFTIKSTANNTIDVVVVPYNL